MFCKICGCGLTGYEYFHGEICESCQYELDEEIREEDDGWPFDDYDEDEDQPHFSTENGYGEYIWN